MHDMTRHQARVKIICGETAEELTEKLNKFFQSTPTMKSLADVKYSVNEHGFTAMVVYTIYYGD